MSSIVSWAARLPSRIYRNLPRMGQRSLADLVETSAELVCYRRLAALGFQPGGIIDVGAYEGHWSRIASRAFRPVPMLMIEAVEQRRPALEASAATLPDARVEIAMLSARPDEDLVFYELGTGSSILPEQSNARRTERRLVSRTLDQVAGARLPGAADLFLKLDVQGAEMIVLAGGEETLRRTALLQLEVSLLQYNAGAPLLPETVARVAELGFLPVEIAGYGRVGGHLVQIDMVFARDGGPLRPQSFVVERD